VIESLLHQILLYVPLILGAYFSLSLMKVPDLSLESAYLFGAVFSATFPCQQGVTPFLIALLGGAVVGLTSSMLNKIGNIPFLLAAILTNGLFHGISQILLGKAMFSLSATTQSEFFILCVVSIVVLLVGFFLLKSHLGYSLAIYGNNPHFFKQHAVSDRYVVIGGIVIANSLAGLSGYLFCLSNGFVDLTIGFGIILLCITALVLGRAIVRTNKQTILCPITGVCAYFVLQDFLVRTGFSLKYFNAFQALLVLGTLILLRKKQSQTLLADHLGV